MSQKRGFGESSIKKNGYLNLITVSRTDLDLTNSDAVGQFFYNNKIDYVLDAAAKVGGINANETYSAEFIFQNIITDTQCLRTCMLSILQLNFEVTFYCTFNTLNLKQRIENRIEKID